MQIPRGKDAWSIKIIFVLFKWINIYIKSNISVESFSKSGNK